jgi:hypothetical protein
MQEITNLIIKAIEKKNLRLLLTSIIFIISFIAPGFLFIFFYKRVLFLKLDIIKLLFLVIIINLIAAIPMYFIKWVNEMLKLFFSDSMDDKHINVSVYESGEQKSYIKALFHTEMNLVLICIHILICHIFRIYTNVEVNVVLFYILINLLDIINFIKNIANINKVEKIKKTKKDVNI